MNIIFLGLCFSESERFIQMERTKCGLQSAPNNFQWALFNSLNQIIDKTNDKFYLLYAQPLGTYPKNHKDLIISPSEWKEGVINARSVGYINLPFIKSWCIQNKVKNELRKIINSLKGETIVITYNLYRPFLQSVYKLKEEGLDFKIVNIVLDMTLNLGKVSKNIIRRIYDNFEERGTLDLKNTDGFILLTEEMKYPLNVGKRPYLVMEGLVDFTLMDKYANDSNPSNYILYSGALDYPYGIADLIEAFILYKEINTDSDIELWICGNGNMTNIIKEYSAKYPFIIYKGFVPREEALTIQSKSYFLINPRPNVGEYVKYSFPSKTLEYMALGKVVLMHRLSGLPIEYDKYLFYFNSYDKEDMAMAIERIINKGKDELKRLGKLNRDFALNQKNAITQTNRVINFLRQLTNEE